jgi:hypothetical protein
VTTAVPVPGVPSNRKLTPRYDRTTETITALAALAIAITGARKLLLK